MFAPAQLLRNSDVLCGSTQFWNYTRCAAPIRDPRRPDFESCVPCPASRLDIWWDTHLYRYRNFWITLTNRSQDFLRLLLWVVVRIISPWYLFYITIVKNNITRMICYGFVVVNRRRSEDEPIILSLHLCLVTLRYIRQLLKLRQSVRDIAFVSR
jgi:hypothetical protein